MFPTRVGMDRSRSTLSSGRARVPHARGDGPTGIVWTNEAHACSPRAWGWTGQTLCRPKLSGVFPTRVGMDRPSRPARGWRVRVPHARGDGPVYVVALAAFSNVFPTRVGMDRTAARQWSLNKPCSPRAWGWTANGRTKRAVQAVFPTRVGMDRLTQSYDFRRIACSPRAWGWTDADATP